MRKSKEEFKALLASGDYYALQKKNDWNRDDITLMREDGRPAEIHNYPYRINQMPTYMFHELLDEGVLKQDGTDEHGGTIFRTAQSGGKRSLRAA
jgi:hypothetical protein